MAKNFADLLFDIEAGGLSGYQSSIYSISYGQGQDIRTLGARPVPGTYISSWAAQNVWKPLQASGMPLGSEREALQGFLGVLEANKGKTLAGWNIGYQAAPQEIGRTSVGFDIPMLMTRAKEYGLEGRYRSAFQGVKVRDVGQETALRLAKIVSQKKYQALVDPALWEQARSYKERGWEFQRAGATHQAEAKYIATQGYKFAGWKQSTVYELLTGRVPSIVHQSAADIKSLQEIMNIPLTGLSAGDELSLVQRWNTLALRDKALASNRPIETVSKIRDWSTIDDIWKFAGRHKLGVGVVGFLGVALGASAFSGKDDNYNVIEGLGHRGIAPSLRKKNTDFAFGYQGDTSDQRYQVKIQGIFKELTKALPKYGLEVGTGHKRIAFPQSVFSQEDIEQVLGFVPVKIAIPESGQTEFESWRNPESLYHIHKHADLWLMHSDRYEAATMTALAAERKGDTSFTTKAAAYLEGMPHVVTEGVPGLYYYLKGQITSGEAMARRVLEELPEDYYKLVNKLERTKQGVVRKSESFYGRTKTQVRKWIGNTFSGKDDEYNTIEGLGHQGIAWQMRREMTDFGSGFIGKVFGGIENFLRTPREKILGNVLRYTKRSSYKPLRFGYRQVEILKEIDPQLAIIAKEILRERFDQSFKVKGAQLIESRFTKPSYITISGSQFSSSKALLDPGKSRISILVSKKGSRLQQQVVLFHELTEADVMKTRWWENKSFGPHSSSTVIADEMLFAASQGKEAWEWLKKLRLQEISDIRKAAKKGSKDEVFAAREMLRTYVPRVQKMFSSFEKKWLPKFSGFDDTYNTIEGLRHGGLASYLRKILTDFGSGFILSLWQGIRSRIMSWGLAGSLTLGSFGGFQQQVPSFYRQPTISSFTTQTIARQITITPPKVGASHILFTTPDQFLGQVAYAELGLESRPLPENWGQAFEEIRASGKKNIFLGVHGVGGTAFGIEEAAETGKISVVSASRLSKELPSSQKYTVRVDGCNVKSSLRSNRGIKVTEVRKAAKSIGYHINSIYDEVGYIAKNIFVSPKLGLSGDIIFEDLPRKSILPLRAGESSSLSPFVIESLYNENFATNIPTNKYMASNVPQWGKWKDPVELTGLTEESLQDIEKKYAALLERQKPYQQTITETRRIITETRKVGSPIHSTVLETNLAVQSVISDRARRRGYLPDTMRRVVAVGGRKPPLLQRLRLPPKVISGISQWSPQIWKPEFKPIIGPIFQGMSPELEVMERDLASRFKQFGGEIDTVQRQFISNRAVNFQVVNRTNIAGKTAQKTITAIAKKGSIVVPKAVRIPWKGVGIGVGILGGLALLYGAISRDTKPIPKIQEAYGEFSGAQEGGHRAGVRMRHQLTDFGMKYTGLLKIPKVLESIFTKAGVGAETISKGALTHRLQGLFTTERGLTGIISQPEQQAIRGLLSEAQASPFKDIILMNMPALREVAKVRGKFYLRGTVAHERFHQALTESGKRTELLKGVSVPSVFKSQLEVTYAQKGMTLTKEGLQEEFLAHSITTSYTGEKMGTFFSSDVFKTGRKHVGKIEKKLQKRFLKQQLHNIASQNPAKMAKDAGIRHRGQAGKDWYNK